MIPSPKERFIADAALAKTHADTVGSTAFVQALDAALLEYGAQCARHAMPGVDESGLLLRGAHEFARLLTTLAEPRTRETTHDRDNL